MSNDKNTETEAKPIQVPMRIYPEDKEWFAEFTKGHDKVADSFAALVTGYKNAGEPKTIEIEKPVEVIKEVEKPLLPGQQIVNFNPETLTSLEATLNHLIEQKRIPVMSLEEFIPQFLERAKSAYINKGYQF